MGLDINSRRMYQHTIEKVSKIIENLLSQVTYINTNTSEISQIRIVSGLRDKTILYYIENDNRLPDNLEFNTVLPIISYQIDNIEYDAERRLNEIERIKFSDGYEYTPVPIKLSFNCSLYTIQVDTLYQITEQLFLLFSPKYVIDIRYFDSKKSISTPIYFSSNSINIENEYEVSSGERVLTYDFSLTLTAYLFKLNVERNPVEIQVTIS